jgi:hypothetical protein
MMVNIEIGIQKAMNNYYLLYIACIGQSCLRAHLFGDGWPTSGSIFLAVSSQIIPNQFHG